MGNGEKRNKCKNRSTYNISPTVALLGYSIHTHISGKNVVNNLIMLLASMHSYGDALRIHLLSEKYISLINQRIHVTERGK